MPSLQHNLFGWILGAIAALKPPRDEAHARAMFARMHSQKPALPPKGILKTVRAEVLHELGFPVWTLAPKSGSTGVEVVYLHGGAYVGDASVIHWNLCAEIARDSGATVLLPIYPLAPEATWSTSFEALLQLARGSGERAPVLMGDSAGGGLALALAQRVAAGGGSPRVALISPWLDVTMSDPTTPIYDRADPILSAPFLQVAGRFWAGGDDPRRAEVSPQFGSLRGIHELLLFSGSRDVLYPQALRLVADAKAAGITCTAHLEEGLVHVYPLLPIPEAKGPRAALSAFVRAHS